MTDKPANGFTLIELLVTMAIVAILAVAGIPMFGDLVKNNRITAQANSVITALHYARSESINRGVDARVEPVVAGTDWSAGWRVRVDGNNDGDFSDSDDVVTRTFDEVESSSLTSSENNIVYTPNGQVDAGATLTLLADECTGEHKRVINVKPSGHVWLDENDRDCP